MTTYTPTNDWRIRINGNEHGVPHVHVEFRDGNRVSVAIATGEVLAGQVSPTRRLLDALNTIRQNQTEYLDKYRRLNP